MAEIFIAGAIISAYSSYRGSQAASDALQAQAANERIQAEIARVNAEFVARRQLKAGREEATFRRRESRREAGADVVRVAGSGVELSGSPMARIGENIRRAELNAAHVLSNSQARAFSERARGEAQAVSFRASAGARDEQARIIRVTGWLDTIGAGMSAVGGFNAQRSRRGPESNTNNSFTFDQYGIDS